MKNIIISASIVFLLATLTAQSPPANPVPEHSLTPVFTEGMEYNEKISYDVTMYSEFIEVHGPRTIIVKEIDINSNGKTDLDFEINKNTFASNNPNVTHIAKVTFNKLEGEPSFFKDDLIIKPILLPKMRNIVKQWAIVDYKNLSSIQQMSDKIHDAIKKSINNGDKYTEEDLIKHLLTRPLSLFNAPTNKVKVGETWKQQIPFIYYSKYLPEIEYKLESVRRRGRIEIAKIVINIDTEKKTQLDFQGPLQLYKTHKVKAKGEIMFDVTNKVVNSIKIEYDEVHIEDNIGPEGIIPTEDGVKFKLDVQYRYKSYGTNPIQ